MKNIKQLQSQLDINNLDADKKSGLYSDFKKAGGHVLDTDLPADESDSNLKKLRALAEKRTAEEEAKKLARERQEMLEEEREKRNQAYQAALDTPDENPEEKKEQKPELITTTISGAPKQRPYLDYIISKITAWSGGVIHLFNDGLSDAFLRTCLEDFRNSINHNRRILASVMHQDENASRAIRYHLKMNERFHFYYELLYRLENSAPDDFFQMIESLKSRHIKTPDAAPQFIRLYRIYSFLSKYKQVLYDAAQVVLHSEQELKGLHKSSADANIRFLKGNIHYILGTFLNKLNLLTDYYFRHKYWQTAPMARKSLSFQNFLQPDEKDRLGYYTQIWEKEDQEAERRRRLEEDKQKASETEKKREEFLSHAEQGLIIISKNIRFYEYSEKYHRNKDPRGYLDPHEKIFAIYTLFDFFDKEFSVLLRSSKIEFEAIKDAHGHEVDIHFLMEKYYGRLESIYELVKSYIRLAVSLQNLNVVQNVHAATPSAEIRSITDQEEKINLETIKTGRKLLEDYLGILSLMASDPNRLLQIIKNPSRTIDLESKTIDKKILNGKRLPEAYLMLYHYCCGLFYLLMEGDLCDQTRLITQPKYLTDCYKKTEITN